MAEKLNNGTPVRCDCGKLVAYERDGRIFVMCKHCKQQIEVGVPPREPRAVRAESR